jgi:hypothetical protein
MCQLDEFEDVPDKKTVSTQSEEQPSRSKKPIAIVAVVMVSILVISGIIAAVVVLSGNESGTSSYTTTPTHIPTPTPYYSNVEAATIVNQHIQDVRDEHHGSVWACNGVTVTSFSNFDADYDTTNGRWLVTAISSPSTCTFGWYLYEKSGTIQAYGSYQ